jgi:hypothetical protein
MIVRDEEHRLPGCLDFVSGLVDEIVVVDPGSSDRTAEIAAERGAVVVPFVWQSDFAAARNAALAVTHCEWVLQLDADERLAPGGAAALRRACDERGFECGFVTLLNARSVDDTVDDVVHEPACRYDEPTALARLFRRDDDLRWQGRVHENVAAWMGERRVRRLDAALVHDGYTPEVARARGASPRRTPRRAGRARRTCIALTQQIDDDEPRTRSDGRRSSGSARTQHQGRATRAPAGAGAHGLSYTAMARMAATPPSTITPGDVNGPTWPASFLRAGPREPQAYWSPAKRARRSMTSPTRLSAALVGARSWSVSGGFTSRAINVVDVDVISKAQAR